jgi:hypothetical protein
VERCSQRFCAQWSPRPRRVGRVTAKQKPHDDVQRGIAMNSVAAAHSGPHVRVFALCLIASVPACRAIPEPGPMTPADAGSPRPPSRLRQLSSANYSPALEITNLPHAWIDTDPEHSETSGPKLLHRNDDSAELQLMMQVCQSHADALEKLQDFELVQHFHGEFFELAGWPAYRGQRRDCTGMRDETAKDCFGVVIALDHYSIHVRAKVPAVDAQALEAMNIVASTRAAGVLPDPRQTAAELTELRQATAHVTQLAPDPGSPIERPVPRGPALLAAADGLVFERDARGSVVVWSVLRRGFGGRSERKSYFFSDPRHPTCEIRAGGPCACTLGCDGSAGCASFGPGGLQDLPPGQFAEISVGGLRGYAISDNEGRSSCHVCTADMQGRLLCTTTSSAMRAPRGSFHGLASSAVLSCALDS